MKAWPGTRDALVSKSMLTSLSIEQAANGLSRDAAPFAFLSAARARGLRGALISISAIDGGAPKPLGAHMAVLEDGRWIGHVSGGCVEAAIAAEVVPVIARQTD